MPKKKENDFAPQIDFKEQTPEMQLKEVKPDPLYEKAFLSREDRVTKIIRTRLGACLCGSFVLVVLVR